METKREEDPTLEAKRDSTAPTRNLIFTNSRNGRNQNTAMDEISHLEEIASDHRVKTLDSTEAEVKMLDNNQWKEESRHSKRKLMKLNNN